MLIAKKELQQAPSRRGRSEAGKTESRLCRASSKTGDKNYLDRKCVTLDKEIDQLYGLAEEEIKIVEGNNK
jgi:hypothetical protein